MRSTTWRAAVVGPPYLRGLLLDLRGRLDHGGAGLHLREAEGAQQPLQPHAVAAQVEFKSKV